jgi:hypothetical protein
VDEPIIEMLNARSLERAHFETTDWGRDLLRELDLVVAVGELESMTTRSTLYDVDLKDRVADFVIPLDRELCREHLGVIAITGGLRDADMQAVGRRLVALPRGAMAILGAQREASGGVPAGYGYDAWMSNGDDAVDTQSGCKFVIARPHGPDTAFRRMYGQVLGMIVHRQRARARDAILQHSMKVANLAPGTKAKGDFYINGSSWKAATFEKIATSYYSGGGDGYQVRMTKPGHGKSFIVGPSQVMAMFSVAPTMPDQWVDAGNPERARSPHELRQAAAHAAWAVAAADADMTAGDGDCGPYTITDDGAHERRVVRKMPGGDYRIVGVHRVTFEDDSLAPSSSAFVPEEQRRAA